jgi:hypothetical protein
MQYEGQDEDEGQPMHPYDHSRFVSNPFPKDPPALSPVALLNPRETQTLEERLAHGWERVLRRSDPEHDHDFSIYTGSAGIGYVALHKVLLLGDADPRRPTFLEVARRYLQGAQAMLERRLRQGGREDITFILGTPGVYAPLAVLRKLMGKSGAASQECIQRVLDLSQLFLHQAASSSPHQHHHYPFEILYGAAGYLTSLLYLKEHFPDQISETLVRAVIDHIVGGAEDGPGGAFLWAWHGKHYLGAAHGVSGILTALLDAHTQGTALSQEVLARIHTTIDYLHSLRLPSGNYPTQVGKQDADRLVQWCHGAPGVLLLLVRAYEIFGEPKYLAWAEMAADVVWSRGLLRKGNGLCHGVAGNAYCFLALFRCTDNDIYLHRARVFALAVQDDMVAKHQDTPNHPLSLFEGHTGLLALYTDLLVGDPSLARFPAFEMGPVVAGPAGEGVEQDAGAQ